MELPVSPTAAFRRPLVFCTVAVIAVVLLAVATKAADASLLVQGATFLATAPLLVLLLLLGSRRYDRTISDYMNRPGSARRMVWLLAGCLLCTGIGSGFDPYFWLLMVGLFAALLLGMRELSDRPFGWLDLLAWLIILIPFDYRLTSAQWFGVEGFPYLWWSIVVSLLCLLIWRSCRRLPGLVMSLKMDREDLAGWGLSLAGALLVLLPLGLWSGFIAWGPDGDWSIGRLLGGFIGLFLFVAMPEELLFRGVLMMGLYQLTGSLPRAVILSSLAFGLFHWNRMEMLEGQLLYCALATIAGLFYALAWWRGRRNLLAAMLTHASVDWVWLLFFTTRFA